MHELRRTESCRDSDVSRVTAAPDQDTTYPGMIVPRVESVSMKCEEQIFSISLSVRCGMPSLTKNFLQVGGGGATLHGPSVSW